MRITCPVIKVCESDNSLKIMSRQISLMNCFLHGLPDENDAAELFICIIRAYIYSNSISTKYGFEYPIGKEFTILDVDITKTDEQLPENHCPYKEGDLSSVILCTMNGAFYNILKISRDPAVVADVDTLLMLWLKALILIGLDVGHVKQIIESGDW